MATNGEDRDRRPDEQEEAPPPPRNPFAEGEVQFEDERPALIQSKRSAAIWGVVAALVLALLVGCICITGSIAFAG